MSTESSNITWTQRTSTEKRFLGISALLGITLGIIGTITSFFEPIRDFLSNFMPAALVTIVIGAVILSAVVYLFSRA